MDEITADQLISRMDREIEVLRAELTAAQSQARRALRLAEGMSGELVAALRRIEALGHR